jgi:hypothetical protein
MRTFWSAVSAPFWIAVSRIGLGIVFAHLVLDLLPKSAQDLGGAILSPNTWLGGFDRWDSAYYLDIAQHGYQVHPADLAQHTAFFPGYPLLIAAVHGATGGALSYLDSGLVVSWVALVGAAVLLYRLADRLWDTRVALIATVAFCWFPASLFYLSPYSEALFAFEIILVLTLIERGRFWWAAGVAAFASATSPESVALTLAILVGALLARRGIVRAIGYVVVSGLGIAAYSGYLWSRFHHPFEFDPVQKYWKRSEHFPFVGLYRNVLALEHYIPTVAPGVPSLSNTRWIWILDDSALVVAAALVLTMVGLWVVQWRSGRLTSAGVGSLSVPLPFIVAAVVIVLIAACTTISPYALPTYASSEGEARFVAVAMPLYLSGALLVRRRPALICFALGGCVVAALLFQALYNLGYWVT